MERFERQFFTGERACFGTRGAAFTDCIFDDGESPLKESRDLRLTGCSFRWKYPLWYCENVEVRDSDWHEMARAGVWYSKNVRVENAILQAPKNFRRCDGLKLTNVTFTNAEETLWTCKNVTLERVTAKGPYFGMNCENVTADGLTLDGNYSFDGAKNVTVKRSRLLSKDAFWNAENVRVENSYVCGEYLGWNSENVTFVNCVIESLQGLCYIKGVKLVNCKLLNTTLAFEYSDVDADVVGGIDSVLNPASGVIYADGIGNLTVDPDRVDPEKTKIVLRKEV